MSESARVTRLLDVTTESVVTADTTSAERADAVERFEVLYRLHRDALTRFLRTICASDDEALDVAALTFERAFRALRAGREPGLGWLLRTGRNAAIDARRRSRVTELFLRRSSRQQPAESSAEEQVIGVDTARLIRAAVAALPLSQREAISLRFTTDLTVREIAGVVGRSEAATEKLISRGLVHLKEDLDDVG
jgi:RNA polymerase sigma factor (sigma-70 family)